MIDQDALTDLSRGMNVHLKNFRHEALQVKSDFLAASVIQVMRNAICRERLEPLKMQE